MQFLEFYKKPKHALKLINSLIYHHSYLKFFQEFGQKIIIIFKALYFAALTIFISSFFLTKTSYSQVIDSQFYLWKVYEIQDENDPDFKKCYIVNHPVNSDSDYNSRLKPYLMIARYQKDRIEEVSVYGGYEYKLSSEIFFLVDDLQFRLKTKEDMAWAKTRYEDVRMIEAMLNGGVVRVRSDSAIGRYAIDEYSLKGITRAYLRMREICA